MATRNIRAGSKPVGTETPTERIVNDPNAIVEIKTKLGHTILKRNLSVYDQMLISRAIGAEDSKNEAYVQWCTFAAMISQYDSIPFAIPASPEEFEFIMSKIGDDGFYAVSDFLSKENNKAKKNKIADEYTVKEEIKN